MRMDKRLVLPVMLAASVMGWAQIAGIDPVKVFHAAGPMPSYEVATIKKSDGKDHGPRNELTIRRYVQNAYGISGSSEMRVVGGPAWIASDVYAIQGQVPDALRDAMQKMTPEDRQNQNRMLQQSLLADRFKLKVHFETREMPVYEMTVAKGGLKIKEVPPPPPAGQGAFTPPQLPRNGAPLTPEMLSPGMLLFMNQSNGLAQMATRANTLRSICNALMNESEIGGRPIVDKTGLTGTYDMAMQWGPERLVSARAADSDAPSLFTAVQEQLGLKLTAAKGQVEVVVIDSIERPSEN